MGLFDGLKKRYPKKEMNDLAEERTEQLNGEMEPDELTEDQLDKVTTYDPNLTREELLARMHKNVPEEFVGLNQDITPDLDGRKK